MSLKESLANISLGKTIGAAWVFFVTVYFLLSISLPYLVSKTESTLINNAVNSQLVTIFQKGQENGQNNGYQAAIQLLVQKLTEQLQGGCKEVVPVTIGSGVTIGILSTNCLQQPGATSQPTPAPTN